MCLADQMLLCRRENGVALMCLADQMLLCKRENGVPLFCLAEQTLSKTKFGWELRSVWIKSGNLLWP